VIKPIRLSLRHLKLVPTKTSLPSLTVAAEQAEASIAKMMEHFTAQMVQLRIE
jgi:hypothetical protein